MFCQLVSCLTAPEQQGRARAQLTSVSYSLPSQLQEQAEKLPRASISPGAGNRSRSPFSALLELELAGGEAVRAECTSACSVCAQGAVGRGAGPGQEHILEGRRASHVQTPSHQTLSNPNKIITFCHGGVNSIVTGLKYLSTLSFLDKGPVPHTWTGNLLWIISETQSGES